MASDTSSSYVSSSDDAVSAAGVEVQSLSLCGKRNDKFLREELKFMNDFDPSKRIEQKKKKRYVMDGLGRPQMAAHNIDSCDCLITDCPGCHFPCKKCGDGKCGQECRQNRKWLYESIEIDGRDTVNKERKNPNLPLPE